MKVRLLKQVRKRFFIYYKRKNRVICAIILINLKTGEKAITYSTKEAMKVITKALWGNFWYRMFYIQKTSKDD